MAGTEHRLDESQDGVFEKLLRLQAEQNVDS